MLAISMVPAFLTLVGIALWGVVAIWNYRAKELTKALFWSRLLAPVAAAFLFGAALYLIKRLKTEHISICVYLRPSAVN